MTYAIQTNLLTKSFKSYQKPEGLLNSIKGIWQRKYTNKVALHPTTISIKAGTIVGLVGANGAGKTTLLKILSGLVSPTSGDANILGFRPWERENAYLSQMGILLGQKNQLWWDISPSDSFSLIARIYDLNIEETKKHVNKLATILDCTHVLNTQLRRLSLGERMKMEIIGALIHKPKILFLDEPTIGLDIVAQENIRNFLIQYVKEEKPTVILTSHYMDDIATLADSLLLISKGQIVYQGTVEEFTNNTNKELAQDEEADFEEVIRRFLETESRIR